jgi:hypothetical protein
MGELQAQNLIDSYQPPQAFFIGGVSAYEVAYPQSSVHNGAPRSRRCRCDRSNG